MPDRSPNTTDIELVINGKPRQVAPGTTVATAVFAAGVARFRESVTGYPRAPLCGMGICMECRVTIDGVAQQRSCQLVCRDGMEVVTDG